MDGLTVTSAIISNGRLKNCIRDNQFMATMDRAFGVPNFKSKSSLSKEFLDFVRKIVTGVGVAHDAFLVNKP